MLITGFLGYARVVSTPPRHGGRSGCFSHQSTLDCFPIVPPPHCKFPKLTAAVAVHIDAEPHLFENWSSGLNTELDGKTTEAFSRYLPSPMLVLFQEQDPHLSQLRVVELPVVNHTPRQLKMRQGKLCIQLRHHRLSRAGLYGLSGNSLIDQCRVHYNPPLQQNSSNPPLQAFLRKRKGCRLHFIGTLALAPAGQTTAIRSQPQC
mmetsp:Transcript_51060/g.116273  ORF Transcript_51060/g.116273 Transcript_51060/m.116273 type:complete len:205 (-) Transcript_51060:1068-1682(-)